MWRYEPETRTIRSVPSNHWVASMNSWDGAEDHQANARIIAAAPDLLAALQHMVDMYQRHFDVMPVAWQTADDIARAAIARATGGQ